MIEVILQEIVFSNDKKLTLSLAVEEHEGRNTLKWAVSSEGRSSYPVTFFGNSELALEEFKKRCGEEALHGLIVRSNEIYGSLRGYYIAEKPPEPIKVRKNGYKVVYRVKEEADAWKKSVLKNETLKLRNI